MMYRISALLPILLLAGTSIAGASDDIRQMSAGDSLEIRSGETHTGDIYFAGQRVVVDGTLDGDLVAFGAEVRINGTVNGDLIVWSADLHIDGDVNDSVRFFGANLWHRGRIDGDLLSFSAQVRMENTSTVTGNVLACGGMMEIDGDVGGDLKVLGGQAQLDGTVGGDTEAETDVLKLRSGARLEGDLRHTTREIEMDEEAVVGGKTIERVKKVKPKDEKSSDGITTWRVVFWFWSTLASILLGLVLVALFRRTVPRFNGTIQREGLMGLLIGFGAFLVVPAACLIAILLLISAPVGILGLVVYFVALYLAKMPVALWLGDRMLKLLGSSAPSPFMAIVLGLVGLKLVFAIPYLGGLLTLTTICLGLGTMILATRNHLQTPSARDGAA